MSSFPDLSSLAIRDEWPSTPPPPYESVVLTEAQDTHTSVLWNDELLDNTFEQHSAVCLASKSLDRQDVSVVVVHPRPHSDHHTSALHGTDLPEDIRLDGVYPTPPQKPLVVLCSNGFPIADDLAYLRLYKHLQRVPVRRLHMKVPLHLVADFLESWSSPRWSVAGNLVSLDLTFGENLNEAAPTTKVEHLLGRWEAAAKLQKLSFTSFGGITWKSLATLLPSTLQELHIVQELPSLSALSTLLDVLRSLSDLKSLSLHNALPASGPSKTSRMEPVILPALTKLTLGGSTEARCTDFLMLVRLPRMVATELNNICVLDLTAMGELFSALSARLADARAQQFIGLKYDDAKDVTMLYAWSRGRSPAHPNAAPSCTLCRGKAR